LRKKLIKGHAQILKFGVIWVKLNESVLSGNIADINAQQDNSYHVLNYSSVAGYSLIDGFYIEKGNANGFLVMLRPDEVFLITVNPRIKTS
jgi:hypothetical protein|tara:strand:- start:858 stop:1130 length:273 start_codon:yes stop_codon:yes gene_type:complete